jgi:hypothetical protein
MVNSLWEYHHPSTITHSERERLYGNLHSLQDKLPWELRTHYLVKSSDGATREPLNLFKNLLCSFNEIEATQLNLLQRLFIPTIIGTFQNCRNKLK